MASSSIVPETKPSDRHANEPKETMKPHQHPHRANKLSPSAFKECLRSSASTLSVQSNLVASSTKKAFSGARPPVLNARPFEELVIGPLDPNEYNATDTKNDGSSAQPKA